MNPAEVLERAANLIDKRGHCKGMYENDDGAVCAMGAINLVATGSPNSDTGFSIAANELSHFISPHRFVCIATWNDMPETTAEEVTSTMRATAALLRARSAVTPETVTA